jgi:hypothetical protein
MSLTLRGHKLTVSAGLRSGNLSEGIFGADALMQKS